MVSLGIIDYVTIVVGAVVGISAIVIMWAPDELPKTRLAAEIGLEIGIGCFLGISLVQLPSDTSVFRQRVQAAIIAIYVYQVISFLAFVVSTALAIVRGLDDELYVTVSRASSRVSWATYLVVSVGAFVAYLTVRAETDATNRNTPDNIVVGVLAIPFGLTIIVLMNHVLACVMQRSFHWNATKYYPALMAFLVTVFALLIMLAPLLYIVDQGKGPTRRLVRDTVVALIEIETALLHRVALQRIEEEEEKEADKSIGDAAEPNDPSMTYFGAVHQHAGFVQPGGGVHMNTQPMHMNGAMPVMTYQTTAAHMAV